MPDARCKIHHEEVGVVWIDTGCRMQDARCTMKINEVGCRIEDAIQGD